MPPRKRTIARLVFAVFVPALALAAISFALEDSIVIDSGSEITLKFEGVTTDSNGLARGNILGKVVHKWGVPLDSSIYKLFPSIKPDIWPNKLRILNGLTFWFSVGSQTPLAAQMNSGRGRSDIVWNKDHSSVARMRIEISDMNNVPPDGGFGCGYSGDGYFHIACVLPPKSEGSYRLRFFLPDEQGDWKLVREIPVEDLK